MSPSRPRQWLVWLGGGALLVAMAVDTLAMLGRTFQVPLLGAIEIVQASVLIAASGALVIAALDEAHARVRLVLDRLPAGWRHSAERCYALAALLFYGALLAGSVWIAADLWGGHEESELLRIPYRPLRVVVVVVLFVLTVRALVQLRGRRRQ
jgi:TRAP-type C4-dicarboxylate transport system permease small subunit